MSYTQKDYQVSGNLTGSDGEPLVEAEILVWWQRIREPILLGNSRSNGEGDYELHYEPPKNVHGKLLIQVEARSTRFDEPIRSAVTVAKKDLKINLHGKAPERSEFDDLLKQVRPLLDHLPIIEVEESDAHKDISFLSLEIGKSKEQITQLAIAFRMEEAFKIPAPVFYSFLRQQVPASLPKPLLDATDNFTLIDSLIRRIGTLIFSLNPNLQTSALQAAVKQKIIGARNTNEIPDWVEKLQALRTGDLLSQTYLVGKTTLRQLLTIANLPAEKQSVFATALIKNTLPMSKFWTLLQEGNSGFTPEEATSIERTLSVGVLMKNYVPLIQIILQRFTAGSIKEISSLASLSLTDWEQLVDQSGVPPVFDAVGKLTPAQVYARAVYSRVTRTYPTIALASRVVSGNIIVGSEQGPLKQFFNNNAGLNLIRHNLIVYIKQNREKAFAGIAEADQAAVITNARKLQRVLFVTSDVDAAQTLLEMGFHSATQIAVTGRQQFFLKATQAGLSKHAASQIYNVGAQRYAGLITLYTQMNRQVRGLQPQAIGSADDLNGPISVAVAQDQSLTALFGSQDYCEVDDCTSILSPAAYLCDLLNWLKSRMTAANSALDILNLRRPDIGNLKLNCPNTDTAIPYIDLVNEILADAIKVPTDPNSNINPIWKQTSYYKTQPDLRAAPEYFNQAAYSLLFAANYPHSMPYSEGLDELRGYVQQSGIGLWQLRMALLQLHAPTIALQAAVVAERFNMPPHAVDIISSPDFLTAGIAWNTATPTVDLVPVPAFLKSASLVYDQLLELLQCNWVQGGLAITIAGIDDTCNTGTQKLSANPINAGFLDKANRFLRLWRRTTFIMWELDMILQAPVVGNGTLDLPGLIAIGNFQQIRDTTKLAVDAQLAWFQPMDNISHLNPDQTISLSLYARTFLNPAVVSLHPDADLAALSTGGALVDDNFSHHLDGIQAALGVSGPDATTLINIFGLDAAATLNIANLSILFRISQFVTIAKISVSDLQNVAILINSGVANTAAAISGIFANPVSAAGFLQQIKSLQQSGFNLDTIVYLLTAPAAAAPFWTAISAITDATIQTALTSVRVAMLNPSGGDLSGSVIAAVAAQLGIANDMTAFLMQTLLLPGTATTVVTVLTDPSLISPGGGPYPDLTRVNYANAYAAYELLDKNRLVITKLHLVNADITWLMPNRAIYGGLDFTQLPVLNTQPALGTAELLTTVLQIKLARLFVSAPPSASVQTLYDLIGGVQTGSIATEGLAQSALSELTSWAPADTTAFCNALGLVFPVDYLLPATYDRIRNLAAMITATNGKASGDQLVSWGVVPADEPTAETMASNALKVLKARYSNTDWLAAAPNIVDPLREHRSAALQDYLVGNGDHAGNKFVDLNALFDFFLIDTQMSSCQTTTRIVQAYIAVQIFVERARMNLESPNVLIDPLDDAWGWWSWMKRYRIWEAAREVFLYPENWLIESQRLNRSEIYKKLEQDVHQNEYTSDNFETVSLNYLDGLENIAHLHVTGTCKDPSNGDVYVIARIHANPPTYYYRILQDGVWTGWIRIPLDIKAEQAVPAIYAGKLCIFWPEVKVQNEPHQNLPAPQASANPPSQESSKYVSMSLHFSTFRNGSWATAQSAKGKLFDVPMLSSLQAHNSVSVENLYTLKAQAIAPSGGYGSVLHIDVFRLGAYDANAYIAALQTISADFALASLDQELAGDLSNLDSTISSTYETAASNALSSAYAAEAAQNNSLNPGTATQIGRAIFDGRMEELQLRNLDVLVNLNIEQLLSHAQSTYGPDALALLPLPIAETDPDINSEFSLNPRAGALMTIPADPTQGSIQTMALNFTAMPLQLGNGPLLNTAPIPFRVVGADNDISLDPSTYFFFQDNRRCYYVDTQKWYWSGSTWTPTPPSNPSNTPFEARYFFHRFYHPYTKLLWHELASSGFSGIYNPDLQQNPDQIDPSHADVFSFKSTYQPSIPTVIWGEDNEILDFSPSAAYSVYNWEIFFHNPLYIAGLLSQNQQFEDAMTWFHYIFDPTRRGPDPVPQPFWITKPLHALTSPAIQAEQINNLLLLVNQNNADAINQVLAWRKDPFNPYLLADMRPVAYMKNVVMQYLDNIIAWADNLFATNSREALSEATLLYVIAAEILGPKPVAVTPPTHADDSYNELAPALDAFSNELVDIENALGSGGGGVGSGSSGGTGITGLQTFYFKIPPNDQLLGYWDTVAERLFKLRHCQNLQGGALELALFDAPIDPGLLIKARAAGVDIGSVLADISTPLPNYRYTAMYTQALDFVNAVRAYGQSLTGALEKSDGDALAVLQQTVALDIQQDMDQIFQWQVDKSQSDIDALTEALAIAQAKYDFNSSQGLANAAELIGMLAKATAAIIKTIAAAMHTTSTVVYLLPAGTAGISGFGGTPHGAFTEGGKNAGDSSKSAGWGATNWADVIDAAGTVATTMGTWQHRKDGFDEAAKEAGLQIQQTIAQIASAQILLSIAQQNQTNHQNQEDYIQKQIDFLTNKFTNQDLYDWQVGQLADVYFQSYTLAYRMCKQVERCYQYELGIANSNFIQFGYWDSLHKGLLAGESLNNDLRRMQSSYLDQNKRRFEMSRFISLATLDPAQFQQLLLTGTCQFDLPETLFDNDYPGHYNRHLVRMSLTFVYPSPGKFDNVKSTLTLVSNKVRFDPTAASGADYTETGPADPRFVYNYAAVAQKIVMGNGQDDPGLFLTAISSNISDQRYLPFEGAGAISSWKLQLPSATNEIDMSSVSDVIMHLYYTAMDGGDALNSIVTQSNIDNAPSTGIKLFSARNDFAAPAPTVANPYPLAPWDAWLAKPAATDPDQSLVVSISSLKFPAWTRGKTITITGLTILTVGWTAENFTILPAAPLSPTSAITTTVAGANGPLIGSANLTVPANTIPGKWTFSIKNSATADFRSLTKNDIGDVLLLLTFQTS